MRHHQNVGEYNRCVESKATDWLQSHFGRQLRIKAETKETFGGLSYFPVLGQKSARLPHQPDRRNGERFPRQGTKKRLICESVHIAILIQIISKESLL